MFMQFRGVLDWQCPACLCLNRHSMKPLHYKLRCVNDDCKRTWVLGGMLYGRNGGAPQGPPPDMIPLDGGIWRNGKVHRVVCDSCGDTISEHAPPPVARWPSNRRKKESDGYAIVREGDNYVVVEEKEPDGLSENS